LSGTNRTSGQLTYFVNTSHLSDFDTLFW
jgi:hypothetical protein